jgi:phosphopantetheine adenylyltransferase
MPDERYIYLHSSLVKEIYRLGGEIECLVPKAAVKRLREWKPLEGDRVRTKPPRRK